MKIKFPKMPKIFRSRAATAALSSMLSQASSAPPYISMYNFITEASGGWITIQSPRGVKNFTMTRKKMAL